MAFTAPKTWVTGTPLTASDLNTYVRDNQDALKNPPSDINDIDNGSNFTTTSTTFADVDATEFGATITTTGGDVLLIACFSAEHANSVGTFFRFTVDGTAVNGDDGIAFYDTQGAQANIVTLVCWATGLAAGSHTFKLQWKAGGSGTSTLYAGAGSTPDMNPQFSAREVS